MPFLTERTAALLLRAPVMRRTSYLQDYESSRSRSSKAASPADASRPPSRKAAEWSASRLEDACRAIERMGARLEEVEAELILRRTEAEER